MCPDARPAGDELPALRLVTVPETGPPFDGDPMAGTWREAGQPGDPNGLGAGNADLAGVRCAAGAARPEACGEWPQQFARLLAEALAGARPVRQVLPWTSERARVHLHRLTPLFSSGQRPRVLRVITSRPAREVIEMTVIVAVGSRTRALAVRLEQAAPRRLPGPAARTRPGATPATPAATALGWVCTDIEAA